MGSMAKITDYVKPKEQVSGNYLADKGAHIYEGALDLAETGSTHKAICTQLGISINTLRGILRDDAGFAMLFRQAMEAGSTIVLEELKEIPYSEPDAQRARVKIDALRYYLELRWPHLYGKRMELTIKTLDMRQALDLAQARVKSRGQAIDMAKDNSGVYTDIQSVDPATIAALLE